MTTEENNHSIDYLIRFAQGKDLWLKYLIFEAINTNGNISNQEFDKIYSCLKNEENIEIPSLNIRVDVGSKNTWFKELEHVGGVNALASNQKIIFSENITILYGLNGAGKSSYFKILNEIVGGNERKFLSSNIYKQTAEEIRVKLIYKDSSNKEIIFDNSERGIDPLTNCKVFDSSYLSGLLSQRTQTETILEPLGLHLFKYIVDKIDGLKLKLKDDIDKLHKNKPVINYENFSDSLKEEFINHNVSDSTKNYLTNKFIFTELNVEDIHAKQKEIKSLKQINYSDRIAVLKVENIDLQKVKKFLQNKETLERTESEIKELNENRIVKENINKKTLEKISILREIQFSNLPEWKHFISTGNTLRQKIQTEQNHCIYCQQPLEENALKIIEAYSTFLNDESETILKDAKNRLEMAKKDLKDISVKLNISDDLKSFFRQTTLKNTNIPYLAILEEIEESFEAYKSYILNIEENQKLEKPKINIHPEVMVLIDDKLNENLERIESLNADNEKKEEKAVSLESELKKLLEHQVISNQKNSIEQWLIDSEKAGTLSKMESSINTNSISRLSNKAHDELLTEQLNSTFKSELNNLGYTHLEVKLEKAKGTKGANSTKLTLINDNSINSILSEGEQKAVGLALFIAETKIQKSVFPIILDDPVNSLDHKIAANLSNTILNLENQLIIFNHNRLFQDTFETSKNNHICKAVGNACSNQTGKHILVYDVVSEGKLRKGVLSFHKENNFKSHMSLAKKELLKTPFEENTKVAALLRKAVECLIDEKILNRITPTKYSNKNSRIPWSNFKELVNDPQEIEKLRKVHDRVSGGELHNGTETENNPIDIEEFKEMIESLESVMGNS